MAFDSKTLRHVFDRTDGHCHICRRKLAFSSYGQTGKRGAWEIEHSVARSNGGTNRLNNLYPAHITCNRSKRDRSSRSARGEHGHRAAPLSANAKRGNAVKGGLIGATLGLFVPPQFRLLAMMVGGFTGYAVGSKRQPR